MIPTITHSYCHFGPLGLHLRTYSRAAVFPCSECCPHCRCSHCPSPWWWCCRVFVDSTLPPCMVCVVVYSMHYIVYYAVWCCLNRLNDTAAKWSHCLVCRCRCQPVSVVAVSSLALAHMPTVAAQFWYSDMDLCILRLFSNGTHIHSCPTLSIHFDSEFRANATNDNILRALNLNAEKSKRKMFTVSVGFTRSPYSSEKKTFTVHINLTFAMRYTIFSIHRTRSANEKKKKSQPKLDYLPRINEHKRNFSANARQILYRLESY